MPRSRSPENPIMAGAALTLLAAGYFLLAVSTSACPLDGAPSELPQEVSATSSPPELSTRLFGLSSNSEEVVFRLTRKGGLATKSTTLEVFGDGRLERVDRHTSGAELKRTRGKLGAAELRDVIATAVDHGLMDLDSAALHSKLTGFRPDGQAVAPGVMDASIAVVEVFLEDYVGPGHPGGPASTRVSAQGASLLLRQFPDSAELRGFVAILDRVRDLERSMQPAEQVVPR